MAATAVNPRPARLAEAACLAGLLPPGVTLAALAGPGDSLPLPPAEAARAASLPAGRAAEFAAGRWCAHRALERLGCPEGDIDTGRQGEPRWPEGYGGSITHKLGGAVAVAALAPAAIGVDLEDAMPLPGAVRHLVLLPAEPDLVPGFPVPALVAERIVFSAKEAYYKWHSQHDGTRRPGFTDVRIRLRADGRQPASGSLRAVPVPGSGLPAASGGWVCGQRWIVTAVWTDLAARRMADALGGRELAGLVCHGNFERL